MEQSVKRIFFVEDDVNRAFLPQFEMEDGTIRKTYYNQTDKGANLIWLSEE